MHYQRTRAGIRLARIINHLSSDHICPVLLNGQCSSACSSLPSPSQISTDAATSTKPQNTTHSTTTNATNSKTTNATTKTSNTTTNSQQPQSTQTEDGVSLTSKLHTLAKTGICIMYSCPWLAGACLASAFSRKTARSLMHWWGKFTSYFWDIKFEVSFEEELPKYENPPYLLVLLNQASLVEGLAMTTHFPVPYFVFANVEWLAIPFYGWAFWMLGSVPVIRQRHDLARKALDNAKNRMKNKENCYMSIEGKRSENGSLSPYKRGCAVLAIETGATIIPIIMKGHGDRLPYGEWRVRPGPIEVKLCKRIETKGMTLDDRFKLTDQLLQVAQKELGLIAKL